MDENEPLQSAQATAGERLRLKQLLTKLQALVEDQTTQVEQSLAQLLPQVGEGVASAQRNAELEALLSELVREARQGPSRAQVAAALAAGLELAWEEEQAQAQARERALEQCVAELTQATRIATGLRRQALLTEGLAAALATLSGEGGNPS